MSSVAEAFIDLIRPAFIADDIYQLHATLCLYGRPWPLPLSPRKPSF